jgi:hypothetical protein
MIQKYKPIQSPYTLGTVMLPSSKGDYIRYSDHIKCIESLMDKNFSLQGECLDKQQDKEDLIQAIVRLNSTILKKEQEITAVSDRVNNLYFSDRATSLS